MLFRSLLFNSGYMSNEATLSTLARVLPDCVILSDALNHASMIEGIKHGRSEKIIWKHNDLRDLEKHLAGLAPPGRRLSPSSLSIPWMAILRQFPRSATSRINTMP